MEWRDKGRSRRSKEIYVSHSLHFDPLAQVSCMNERLTWSGQGRGKTLCRYERQQRASVYGDSGVSSRIRRDTSIRVKLVKRIT